MPWGTLFWSAMSGLVVMALGLAITNLIEDLAARSPWLGAIGLALAVRGGRGLAGGDAPRDDRARAARHRRGAA